MEAPLRVCIAVRSGGHMQPPLLCGLAASRDPRAPEKQS